ncbi:hypothetical protein [Levilactobacillus angrenensis]|uniref:Uncharacterized protein n=1 Tax=Levilactobacillus angrenensis TaxID=2486020 RepID=A0ABW1U8M6_9LACO|nr:hypothetical protein [Levilactobacillus angrenensis]
MKRYISLLLLLAALGGGLTTTQPAMAQGKRTLRYFPQRFRGTWYTYDGGRYYQVKITATKMRSSNWTYDLHSRPVTVAGDPRSKRYQHWIIAMVGKKWLWTYGWNQGAGAGSYYSERHHRIHGKTYDTLQIASGAGAWVDDYAYRSKFAAKHFANKRFGDENYRS